MSAPDLVHCFWRGLDHDVDVFVFNRALNGSTHSSGQGEGRTHGLSCKVTEAVSAVQVKVPACVT